MKFKVKVLRTMIWVKQVGVACAMVVECSEREHFSEMR